MTVMTLVWGFGLLADVAISVALIFALSIREYLIVGPILGYGTMGALGLWTFLYGRRARRKGAERLAMVRFAADAAVTSEVAAPIRADRPVADTDVREGSG
jgi:hypothetical protein